ncbi:MAG: protein phosphatase 2C domain-containing protein [Candidatus Adiutrix sp.]|jgi:protein phosphatase|nr:protein phosphatase 2C domain-containing protein [Candidatus Adiutrix sp.]
METSLNKTDFPLAVGQCSHPGLTREDNEDSFGWFSTKAGELLLVADGMGGHAGGEKAAKTAIAAFRQYVDSSPDREKPEILLRRALMAADQAVAQVGAAEPALAGLGSTLVALLLRGREAWHIHVGDSRLYRFSGGALEQLTRDHSYVQELLDRGRISAREAEKHEDRHMLTQSLGGNLDEPGPRAACENSLPGDIFLLCSDGLSGPASKAELRRLLAGPGSAQLKAENLVNLALKAGGPDNVTVQLAVLADAAPGSRSGRITQKISQPAAPAGRRRAFWPAFCLFAFGLVIGGAGLFAWDHWFKTETPPQPETAAPAEATPGEAAPAETASAEAPPGEAPPSEAAPAETPPGEAAVPPAEGSPAASPVETKSPAEPAAEPKAAAPPAPAAPPAAASTQAGD